MTDHPNDRRVAERVASAWSYDPEMERLAADQSVLDGLPPAKRVALGLYITAKKAARRVGIDVTPPEGNR